LRRKLARRVKANSHTTRAGCIYIVYGNQVAKSRSFLTDCQMSLLLLAQASTSRCRSSLKSCLLLPTWL